MVEGMNDHLSVHLQQLGERLYPKVGDNALSYYEGN